MNDQPVLLDSEVGESNPVSLNKGENQIVEERLPKRLHLILSVYFDHTFTYL